MKVILIDGKNACYRFGHVNAQLRTTDGKPTGVLYGLLGAVARLKNKFSRARFMVAWDSNAVRLHSWRYVMFPEYKSNRGTGMGPLPSVVKDIASQIPVLQEIFHLMGIPQLENKWIEADDIIGLMVGICERRKWRPVIYSSDKDFLQLMPYAKIIRDTGSAVPETPLGIMKKFHCTPENVLRVRALTGDKSDTIPGVPGVGEITAAKMIANGARPELASFETMPIEVRKKCFKLEQHWSRINRNYHLMRLPHTVSEIPLNLRDVKKIEQLIFHAERQLTRPASMTDGDYRELLRMLGRYQLSEAIRNRHILSEIQKY